MRHNFLAGNSIQINYNTRVGKAAILALAIVLLIVLNGCRKPVSGDNPIGSQILVFTKTQAFRHECIEPGVGAMKSYFSKYNVAITHSEDSTIFTAARLKPFDAVVFFQTTGNVLGASEQLAFQQYIQSGKGFLGIHSAADTEYDWDWYNQLLGAQFSNHADIQNGVVMKGDSCKIACQHLPSRWTHTDEWYNFKTLPTNVKVELSADETTYSGGAHGMNHPLAWYRTFEGGRSYYTALGHTVESYKDTLFLEHLAKAAVWAAGK